MATEGGPGGPATGLGGVVALGVRDLRNAELPG